MTLAALIARGIQGVETAATAATPKQEAKRLPEIATATAATPATLNHDSLSSVANVASVAVANTPERAGDSASSVANVAGVAVANLPENRIATNSQYDPIRWPRFVALCTAHDVTESEVRAMFTEQDIADLCEEPDGQLPKHTTTIVAAIKRVQRYRHVQPQAPTPTANC